eukprot:3138037-Rhodomonas_salina.2
MESHLLHLPSGVTPPSLKGTSFSRLTEHVLDCTRRRHHRVNRQGQPRTTVRCCRTSTTLPGRVPYWSASAEHWPGAFLRGSTFVRSELSATIMGAYKSPTTRLTRVKTCNFKLSSPSRFRHARRDCQGSLLAEGPILSPSSQALPQ